MIDVQQVLEAVPHFETFCSVEKLQKLVERLRGDKEFEIKVAGKSVNNVPIHHVCFGRGRIKALIVAGPHAMEPIGGLTVYSLMMLLHQRNKALIELDVEWHLVPCIDPDGAILNEGWTQKSFALETYMKNYHEQIWMDQVDFTFPIVHKKLIWDRPSQEAKILMRIFDEVRPDFYYALHNAFMGGGTFYLLSKDIGKKYYDRLYKLLEESDLSLNMNPGQKMFCAEFAEGVCQINTASRYYDYLETKTAVSAEDEIWLGTNSIEYLEGISEGVVSLVTELPYVKHSSDGSTKLTGRDLRQVKLRADAESKFIAALILDEWEKTKNFLDVQSPFYRKIFHQLVEVRERLPDGIVYWTADRTRDLMFNVSYAKEATENELLFAHLWHGFMVLCHGYEFVRLLRDSRQTPEVGHAIVRLERAFNESLNEIRHHVNFDAFEVIDCDTLAKVQLGSGLIVLSSVLDKMAESKIA